MKQIDQIMDMYRHDLSSFTQLAFRILNPYQRYLHNWHVGVITNVLERVKNGDLKKVIINLPPRMLKSHCASVAFPAYMLGRDPTLKILYLHAGDELGRDLHSECTELMQHPRYQALFPHTSTYRFDQRKIETSYGGSRRHATYAGKITGLGADIIILDDPVSATDSLNASTREEANKIFDHNILQRLNNKNDGAIILITQRLHEDDLTAHILKNNKDWHYVNMSAIALHDEVWDLPHNQTHKRLRGEVIHPDRLSFSDLANIAQNMNGYSFAYQYLQGQYTLQFGDAGKGGLYISPLRKNAFYDIRQTPPECRAGFSVLNENQIILSRAFDIGDDPCPPDMRNQMTLEEFKIACAHQRQIMLDHQEKVKNGQLDY